MVAVVLAKRRTEAMFELLMEEKMIAYSFRVAREVREKVEKESRIDWKRIPE